MKIENIRIKNFRRLEDVSIGIDDHETIFVGPNNSGKTSATAAFRFFLAGKGFSIHDFSVSKIAAIDAFGINGNQEELPAIELDIWFSVDPTKVEFGRAFALLPNLTDNFEKLGVRLSYQAIDSAEMRKRYLEAYPSTKEQPSIKSLSQFLAQDRNLKQYFEIIYSSLEEREEEIHSTLLSQSDGKSLLKNLIRVDFVDAQRNIDDSEEHQGNRLSTAFSSFYRKNLDQPDIAAESREVIDLNNLQLTEHYAKQFEELMTVIQGLGVPSINDRDLKLISSLTPETALQGNTELLYVDRERSHELPEQYNGLGFKNLIYMAIQASHFHSQWARTPQNRPLCQMIFIEEPEVHLHAQVQQTFISNIWKLIRTSAKAEGEKDLVPQLVVTTHSSHILDAADFAQVRYFRRCHLKGEDPSKSKILNASEVHSLRDFQPSAVDVEGQTATAEEALEFLKRYLKLTHCDLFFADAAVLVEGSVEKLLLPDMIDKAATNLNKSYLTVLEIGGAFAHRFEGLLEFLHIPYLIITDLDSVEPTGHHKACRADKADALTSNATLKKILGKDAVKDLIALGLDQKCSDSGNRSITFQQDYSVKDGEHSLTMRARTLEESFAHQNFSLLKTDQISLALDIPGDLEDAYEKIYEHIKSGQFKKTDFAMRILAGSADWQVPNYIADGLKWLEETLHGPAKKD